MSTRSPLVPLVRKFFETDLENATRSLESLDEKDTLTVLRTLPSSYLTLVFPRLSVLQASAVLRDASAELFKTIVQKLDPQQGASIFVNLPAEQRDTFIENLSEKTRLRIQELLTYPENSAGRIMSGDYVAFHTNLKARDAILRVRQLAKAKGIGSYLYVIDDEQHLVGILNMRDLLLAAPHEPLSNIMRNEVVAVDAFVDREEIANDFAKHRYFAIPVVDSEKRLIGVVKAEQIIAHVQDEASEDILKMFGAGGDEKTFSPIHFSIRKRIGWLTVNLATAFLASAVVGCFEDIIAQITVLAVLMPIVAGQGGNAGAQSLAVVMRGLVMREIPSGSVTKLIIKEATTGTLNGLIIGLITAGGAWLWNGNPVLGLVIGLAMLINLFAAGLAGAAIPVIMKKMGFDPAQSSSIILTTITDCVGFSSFLGLAVLFRNYLI